MFHSTRALQKRIEVLELQIRTMEIMLEYNSRVIGILWRRADTTNEALAKALGVIIESSKVNGDPTRSVH